MVQGYLSVLIIVISIFSTYMSFILIKNVSGIIRIPFISTYFMFRYFIFAYVGSVLLNVFYFQYEINIGLYNRPDLLFILWLYTTSGLFLIPLGMYIANWATGYKPYKATKKILSKTIYISKYESSNIMYAIIIFLSIVSIYVLFIYISKINTIPIMGLFDGLDAADLALLRSDSGNNFDGKYYRYAMFMKDLPLLLVFIVFFMKNISLKWKVLFYLLVIYNVFVNIMDVQKAPLIKLFMILMLAYFYSQNKISKKVMIVTGAILSIVMVLMYIFIMGMTDQSFIEILSAPLHRIFIGQISPFYFYQLFQEQNGYIYGTSFPNPGHIFPFEWRRITVEIMNFAFPEMYNSGVVGSMPTVFFADWFINFGPLMALFSMILFGFILQISDILFISKLSKNKSLLLSVFFIFMINYFGKFSGTSNTGIFNDTAWIFPAFVIFFITFTLKLSKLFIRRINEKKYSVDSIK